MSISIDSKQAIQSMQSIPSMSTIGKNTILLKNMHLHPQIIKISLHQPLVVKVSHNNCYKYSQISNIKKKFIFSIQQLQLQSDPLQEGQQYEFNPLHFHKTGQFQLICINIPKISSKVIVQNIISSHSSQSEDQLLISSQSTLLNLTQPLKQTLFNQTQPIKLTSVQEEQPQQEILKQQQSQQIGLSTSLSDLQQYERILTQSNNNKSDTLQNKYLNYFKQEFKLWRNFFQQQQLKQKNTEENKKLSTTQEKLNKKQPNTQTQQITKKNLNIQNRNHQIINDQIKQTKNNLIISSKNNEIVSSKNNEIVQTISKSIIQKSKHEKINQTNFQIFTNKDQIKVHQSGFQKQEKKKDKTIQNQYMSSPQPVLINHHHNKKLSLKQNHTTPKNLSLSQVKEVDPNNKNKSQYEYDSDNSSSQQSKKGISIASQLYSHQEIIDRNNDYEEINSGRKQMKKTNSEYGFNVMRSQQQKEPTLDKISVFGKQQQELHLPQHHSHSRRSNHQTTPSTAHKNNKKSYSRISMSRTQTNSPALKQYKKQNNFLTWATQWAKQKQYKPVAVEKMNDHHLIKQFNVYIKNKFKVTQFMYC